jgi:hypothetical protein
MAHGAAHGWRFVLLAAGAASLLVGMWLGLARLGLAVPLRNLAPGDHGPLMVSGFLGTVISLERAVALRARWGYLAPVLAGLGGLVTLLTDSVAGPLLSLLASGVVVAILAQVVRLDRSLHHWLLSVAGGAWLAGNLRLLLGAPVFDVVPWWWMFLTLTIAAERLELNRLLRPTAGARAAFVAAVATLGAGALASLVDRAVGFRLLGLGSLGIAVWLLQFDIARRTIRQSGMVRFIATSLLSGYLWLAVGGALAAWWGHPVAGPLYDAMLHAVLVGFVFSMIFGHALVIVPAVLGVAVPYRSRFYLHLGLLHLSLVLRVVGDLGGEAALRQLGGVLNLAAVLLFIGSTVASAAGGQRESVRRSV